MSQYIWENYLKRTYTLDLRSANYDPKAKPSLVPIFVWYMSEE